MWTQEFHKLGLPLHVLINNAGVMNQDRMLTQVTTHDITCSDLVIILRTITNNQDGFEMVFTANHLSHFLLTNLLLGDLEKTS